MKTTKLNPAEWLVFILILMAILSGCTENQRARNFGGKQTVSLKPNEVLINLTWKDDDLWILTEDTALHEMHFRENSSFGILNGEILIP